MIKHNTTPSQTLRQDINLIIALLCALVVAAYDRRWLARPVKDLIPDGSGIRLEWLSHLKARVLGKLKEIVEEALRRGRPVRKLVPEIGAALADELGRVRGQYLLRVNNEPRRKVQEWLVEVYGRLKKEFGLCKERFCSFVAIPERTFRFWCRRTLAPLNTDAPVQPSARRPRGEGRFDLECTLPGIQQMADTTDWKLLGIALKVMASQDPGNRHRQIASGVVVSLNESGQKIMKLQEQVSHPGTQVITDRGTPYMSQSERMQEQEIEHAPCKEYTPTEKATCERSFRTIKEALQPIVEFLDDLSGKIPQLRCAKIAVELGNLLFSVFLHVYKLGHSHVGHPLDGSDPELLRCVADEQREKARCEDRSKLSNIERIHEQYNMSMPKKKFIRAYRSYALEDILEAENRMGQAAGYHHIWSPHQYFAAIIKNVAQEGRLRRHQERERRKRQALERQQESKREAEQAYLEANPIAMLSRGLEFVAIQWLGNRFLFEDAIVGRSRIEQAVEKIAACDPLGFEDTVHLECRRWHEHWKNHDASKKKIPLEVILNFVDDIIEERKQILTRDMEPPTLRASMLA